MRTHFYYITSYSPEPSLLESFLNYEPLSQLMQGAGVAVLTLLVSFAIGIFIHHLDDGRKRKNFLDLHVALDYVWMFKRSIIGILVLVLSPFLMSVESLSFKTSIFVIWATALGYIIWIIFRLYGWVKGDRDEFRKKYLSGFPKTSRDKVIAWGDLWSSEEGGDDCFREKDFFIIFSQEVDRLLVSDKKEDRTTLTRLLGGFVDKIENRNKTFLLVFPEFFPKVLSWHFLAWENNYSRYSKDRNKSIKTDRDSRLFEINRIIDQIIRFINKEALTGSTNNAYSYFETLEKHIKKYEDKTIEGNNRVYGYIEHIPIYTDCLSFIPKSRESYDIWNHYFPESWKITINNLRSNKISRVWLVRFSHWSRSRIWRGKKDKEWDEEMEEISKELFPSTDPITWAKIYTFVQSPYSGSRVKQIIERGVNFGYTGRVVSGWGDDLESNFSKVYEAELEATFDLAVYLFPGVLTKNNLDGWISELDELNYLEDSYEFRRMQVWRSIFLALKKRI